MNEMIYPGFNRVTWIGAIGLLILAGGMQSLSAEPISGTFTGEIKYMRLGEHDKPIVTNIFSVSGVINDSQFRVDVYPVQTEDDIEEHAGWDSNTLYLLQRFPEEHGKGLPRSKSLAYMEPTVFSRYATHPTAALCMALADSNAVAMLTNPEAPPILLGTVRIYPEEKSHYILDYRGFADWSVKAICPGYSVGGDYKLRPLEPTVYENGFPRWRFSVEMPEKTANSCAIHFLYERFTPKYIQQSPTNSDDVSKVSNIEGNLRIVFSQPTDFDYHPKIVESSLTVIDLRGRKDFIQTAGSYDKDYMVHQVVTDKTWNIDERNAVKGVARTQIGIQAIIERQRRYSHFRWLFYFIAAVVFACPLIFAVKWRASKKEKHSHRGDIL